MQAPSQNPIHNSNSKQNAFYLIILSEYRIPFWLLLLIIDIIVSSV